MARINGPVMCVNHPERFAFEVFNDRGLCRECWTADRARLADEIVRALVEVRPCQLVGTWPRPECRLCRRVANPSTHEGHAADCLWLRAKRYCEEGK